MIDPDSKAARRRALVVLLGLALLWWAMPDEPPPVQDPPRPEIPAEIPAPETETGETQPAAAPTAAPVPPAAGTPRCVRFATEDGSQPVSALTWSPDGKHLAWLRRGAAWIWDVESPVTPPPIRQSAGPDLEDPAPSARLTALAWDSAGLRQLAGDARGALTFWDPFVGEIGSPRRHVRLTEWSAGRPVDAVAWSGDAVAASVDGSIALWDAEGRRLVSLWAGHAETVTSLQFRRDGKALLSIAADHTVRLWAPTGRLLEDFSSTLSPVTHAGYDRFGWIVTWGRAGSGRWGPWREAGGLLPVDGATADDQILLVADQYLLRRTPDGRGAVVHFDAPHQDLPGLLPLDRAVLAPDARHLAAWTDDQLCIQELTGLPSPP